jgi:ATP-dependent DNA helicase Q1
MKLLYVTPERIAKSKRLMNALQKCYENKYLVRIAIDEVHCCSVLGHDFRPDFKHLGVLKTLFPETPILGVTATASRKILVDIQKILNIRGCIILTTPFNRPNLFYGILEKPSSSEGVVDLISGLLKNRYKTQSGIIYTFSIKDAETLANELLQEEVSVRAYHADLTPQQRSKVYTKWMNNEIQAVVATIAFGMGIDKPDVRFVIHHTLSKSMENFYQESGRCGRDGNYAECILLYRFGDMFKLSAMTFSETNGLQNTYSVINYCINPTKCRRDLFSNYFTEVWSEDNCGKMCDHCFDLQHRKFTPPKIDILPYYHILMKILDKAHKMDTKMTALKLIDAWFCKGPAKLRIDSQPPQMDRSYAEKVVAFLIIEDYLREDIHYTPYSTISYIQSGHRTPPECEIEFQASSFQNLPSFDEIKEFYNTVTKERQQTEVVLRRELAELASNSPSKRKRRYSDDSDNENISMSSAALEKLIEKKLETKMKQFMSDKGEGSFSHDIIEDDVMEIPLKHEVIDIDEIDDEVVEVIE